VGPVKFGGISALHGVTRLGTLPLELTAPYQARARPASRATCGPVGATQRRAAAVKAWLVSNGASDPDRLKTVGESRGPSLTNRTDEGRFRGRRVESRRRPVAVGLFSSFRTTARAGPGYPASCATSRIGHDDRCERGRLRETSVELLAKAVSSGSSEIYNPLISLAWPAVCVRPEPALSIPQPGFQQEEDSQQSVALRVVLYLHPRRSR
jgi:hypothetical protein